MVFDTVDNVFIDAHYILTKQNSVNEVSYLQENQNMLVSLLEEPDSVEKFSNFLNASLSDGVAGAVDSDQQTYMQKDTGQLTQKYLLLQQEAHSKASICIENYRKQNMTISTAESFTGGLLFSTLAGVPNVVKVIMQGNAVYSNVAKEKLLGVNHETIKRYGTISRETASEMVEGLIKLSGESDVGISITGIAGPGAHETGRPIGLVYIASLYNGDLKVHEFNFKGNRQEIRIQAVISALDVLTSLIK